MLVFPINYAYHKNIMKQVIRLYEQFPRLWVAFPLEGKY